MSRGLSNRGEVAAAAEITVRSTTGGGTRTNAGTEEARHALE